MTMTGFSSRSRGRARRDLPVSPGAFGRGARRDGGARARGRGRGRPRPGGRARRPRPAPRAVSAPSSRRASNPDRRRRVVASRGGGRGRRGAVRRPGRLGRGVGRLAHGPPRVLLERRLLERRRLRERRPRRRPGGAPLVAPSRPRHPQRRPGRRAGPRGDGAETGTPRDGRHGLSERPQPRRLRHGRPPRHVLRRRRRHRQHVKLPVPSRASGHPSGVQAMSARRVGEGRPEIAAVPLNAALVICVVLGVPMALAAFILAPELVPRLTSDPAVIEASVPYLRARACAPSPRWASTSRSAGSGTPRSSRRFT